MPQLAGAVTWLNVLLRFFRIGPFGTPRTQGGHGQPAQDRQAKPHDPVTSRHFAQSFGVSGADGAVILDGSDPPDPSTAPGLVPIDDRQ